MKVSQDLLKAWPLSSCVTEVWRAAVGRETEGRLVARAYLAALARPSSSRDVFDELLAEGSFTEAEELRIELAKESDEAWDEALRKARSASVRELENDLTELAERCRRVQRSNLLDRETIEEIRTFMGLDKAMALDALAPIEQALKAEEEAYAKRLRKQLAETERNEDPVAPGFRGRSEAVRRAIKAREFDVAEHLLTAGPAGGSGEDRALPRRRKVDWIYRNQSPRVILDWLLKRSGGSPAFYSTWCPEDDDKPAWELLKMLEAFFQSGGDDDNVVIRFTDALEAFLGQTPSPSRELERLPGGGFRIRLRGLGDPGAPALAAVAGVRLYLSTGGEGGFEDSTNGEPVVLFRADRDAMPAPGCLQLTATDIFRALPNPAHRRVEILRSLVPQIPVPRPFEARPATLSPLAFFGREEELRRLTEPGSEPVQLVFGAPGVGTSALLQKAASELEKGDWEIVDEQRLPSGAALERRLESGRRAGLAATGDGVSSDTRDRLSELLDYSRRFGDRFRVILAGDLDAKDCLAPQLAEAQCWQLRPFPFSDARALAGRLLDFRGVRPFDAAILDRLAFYAAGRPALLHLLVDSLLFLRSEADLPANASITRSELEGVVRDHRFQKTARRWLLDPVERDPTLHTVYAGVLTALDLDGSLDGSLTDRLRHSRCEDIHELLTGDGFAVEPEPFLKCLKRLAELEIVEPVDGMRDRVVLAPGAVARMCVELSGNPRDYLEARRSSTNHRRETVGNLTGSQP